MPQLLPIQDPTNPELWPTQAGYITVGINLAGQWTLKTNAGVITPLSAAPGFHSQTCSGGNGTITPAAATWVEQVIQTGAGGTRQFAISIAGQATGTLLFVQMPFPTVSGIRVQVYNANLSGTLLADYTSDASGNTLALILFFDGTNWNLLSAAVSAV
jgi:hypothetical protein